MNCDTPNLKHPDAIPPRSLQSPGALLVEVSGKTNLSNCMLGLGG